MKKTDREKSLNQLAIECGTDKSSEVHNYTKNYESLFEPFRDKKIKIFEIGVHRARSHWLWSRYFQNAHVYGIDHNQILDGQDYVDYRGENLERIHLYQMDQGDFSKVKNFAKEYGPFNIIIDDGSHNSYHQIGCFKVLRNFTLNYYIIEDLHPEYKNRKHFTIEYFNKVINNMNCVGTYKNIDWVMFPKNEIVIKMGEKK